MPLLQSLVLPTAEHEVALALYVDAEGTPAPLQHTRTGVGVPTGRSVSFATYFNAFPASYWQHWTNVRQVTLTVTTSGSGEIALWTSDAAGRATRRESRAVAGDLDTVVFSLVLDRFDAGGWAWFEASASSALTIASAEWSTDAEVLQPGRLALGTTTVNKPDYAVATLRTIADDPVLVSELERVVVVDQGTRLVQEEPGYLEVAARLGDLLTVIRQPNLGGSGGYARVMAETLGTDASAVMLVDDDVQVETEGILRALRFFRHCPEPRLVGGHMFDLNHPTVLHAFAETVRDDIFFWGPADVEHERHDFGMATLKDTPWLHQRAEARYNGWWMCLIPTRVIREIGLPLPLFIKWDDVEYALRAGEAGFATVSLPGSGLWHLTWLEKDDTLDWQAFFHARNRAVTALLHLETPHRFPVASRRQDLRSLLSMQYYAAELRRQGLAAVLAGPDSLHRALGTTLPALRGIQPQYREMTAFSAADVPEAYQGRAEYPGDALTKTGIGLAPQGPLRVALTAWLALRHLIVPVKAQAAVRPQRELTRRAAQWWRLGALDSARIVGADGTVNWNTRDRARFRRYLRDSIRQHRALQRDWPRLREQYRRALPELTSLETWQRTFHG